MTAVVADPLPAIHAPVIPSANKKRPPRPAPFDPDLLSHKLEAHKQAQDHERRDRSTRLSRRSRDALKAAANSTYVPRTAAQQFALTANPGEKESHPKRVSSAKHRPRPLVIVQDACKFNPKQIQAGLSLGMSESEIIAAMSAPVRAPVRKLRRGSDSSIPVKRTLHPPAQSRSRSRSQTRRPKDSSRKTSPAPSRSRTRTVKPRELRKKPSSSPSGQAEAQPYRPGDAAKRNEDKRRSFMMPPLSGTVLSVSVEHESFWSPLRDLFIDNASPTTTKMASGIHNRNKENEMPYDMRVPDSEKFFGATRPKLGHDRHDWAQASQYGDDVPQLTTTRPRQQRRPKADLQPGSATTSSRRAKSPAVVRPQTSKDEISSDDKAVSGGSDADKSLKHEQKARRRQSIAGFFKRK